MWLKSVPALTWPELVNGHTCVEGFLHPDKTFAVFVVRRSEGTYTIFEEQCSKHMGAWQWSPVGMYSSIYDSYDGVRGHLESLHSWVSDVQPFYAT